MAIQQGALIESADYNSIAAGVNKLWADTSNLSTRTDAWSTANLIVDSVGNGTTREFSFTVNPDSGDFLVVSVNNVTTNAYGLITNGIRFNSAPPNGHSIKVYNRQNHRFGWGQTQAVHPISEGENIRSRANHGRETIDANLNYLIDTINLIDHRTGNVSGSTMLSRTSSGNDIHATEYEDIQNYANNGHAVTRNNYWLTPFSTMLNSEETFTRTASWDNILIGTMRYTWDNYNEFRYFFNSGGWIRAEIMLTGGSGQGYANWEQVISQQGALMLDYNTVRSTGGGLSSNIGAYELTTAFQKVFESSGPRAPVSENLLVGEYSQFDDLVMVWDARLVENQPIGKFSLEFKVTLDDKNLNATTNGNISFRAGSKTANDVNDTVPSSLSSVSAPRFTVTRYKPTITAANEFTTSDDS